MHAIFVETPVAYEFSQILQKQDFVLIIGEPGIGKSMLMHHMAWNLHKEMGYRIVQCSGISDVLNHYDKNVRQLLVVEDICGRYSIRIADLEFLMTNENAFKKKS